MSSSSSASFARPSRTLRLCVLAALPTFAAAKDTGGGWEESQNEDGKVVQQLKIEAPAMTEEDQYGHVMPDRYKCDSCKAVMFHLDEGLRKAQPKSRRMKEWEFTDTFEEVCKNGFPGYGIKLINGENALSGAGLPRDDTLAPGAGAIQMSSENWSKRLGEVCRKIVFETMGEEETYEAFYNAFKDGEKTGLNADLCLKELRYCTAVKEGPKPPKKEEKPKKDKKDKKKDKKDKKAKKDKKDKESKKNEVDVTIHEAAQEAKGKQTSSSEKMNSATALP